jgi:hypothetical protein
MNTKDLEILKANIDEVIKIISRDGETLLAKVVLVSEKRSSLDHPFTGAASINKNPDTLQSHWWGR